MEKWKRIAKALLFPPIAILLILLPVASVFLVYAMVFLGTDSVPAYCSYALSAYTLTLWCIKLPRVVTFCKRFKRENRVAVRLSEDVRLRVKLSLYGAFLWNVAYAAFQLALGLYHASFWFFSMAGYYVLLGLMRFFLLRHTEKYRPGEKMEAELRKYRACGRIFLLMNLTLSIMIFFMIYWDRSFHHHEITTIAMAAYTFITFTVSIVNLVKYKKYDSPVYSASKAISLAAACVSMITLTSTMLTTFGEGSSDLAFRPVMLAALGGAVALFIIAMAVYMIAQGTNKLKQFKTEVNNEQK